MKLSRISEIVHCHHYFESSSDRLKSFKRIVRQNIEIPMEINCFLVKEQLLCDNTRIVLPVARNSSILSPDLQNGADKIFSSTFTSMLMFLNKTAPELKVHFGLLGWNYIDLDLQTQLLGKGVSVEAMSGLDEEQEVVDKMTEMLDRDKVSDEQFRSKEWKI